MPETQRRRTMKGINNLKLLWRSLIRHDLVTTTLSMWLETVFLLSLRTPMVLQLIGPTR